MARGKGAGKAAGKAAAGGGAPEPEAGAGDEGLPDFEGALEELETIVGRLDAGELSLADSLEAFERGIRLTRTCEAALGAAEARVAALLAEDGVDPDEDRLPAAAGGSRLLDDELDEGDYEDEFGDPDRED